MLNYDDGDNEVEAAYPQDSEEEFEEDLPTKPGIDNEDHDEPAVLNNSNDGGNPLVTEVNEEEGETIRTENKYISINSVTDLRMCTLCGVTFTSSVLERDHMRGKRHEKNIRKARGLIPTASVIKRFGQCGQFGQCSLCDVLYDGPNDAVAHLFSEEHLRAQEKADIAKGRQPSTLKLLPIRKKAVEPKKQPMRSTRVQQVQEMDPEELGMKCIYTKASSSPKKAKTVEKKKPLSKKRKLPVAGANGKKKRVKRFCRECGSSILPSSKFCGECGSKI